VVAVVEDKNSIYNATDQESFEATKSPLIQNEPIHYHILAPNEPHPYDKYGCHEKTNINSATATTTTISVYCCSYFLPSSNERANHPIILKLFYF